MTSDKLTELRRLAEAAKANLDQPYYSAKCVECGFELSHRHNYQCSVPENRFKKEANPAAILELLDTLERAVETIKQCKNAVSGQILGNFEYVREIDNSIKRVYMPNGMGKTFDACREFLASLEGGKTE